MSGAELRKRSGPGALPVSPDSGPIEGLVSVEKPAGMTSHDVVDRIRHAGGLKRVGHAGTLDPFATGVLPVALGRATRLLRFLGSGPRTYRAWLRLGQSTDTDDLTGALLGEPKAAPARLQVEACLATFLGQQLQLPPRHSAKKIAGERAYRIARRGGTVELAPSQVEILALELQGWKDSGEALIEVVCSRGTYVRALARDVGERLGCGAHLTTLERTACGPFRLAGAVPLADIKDTAALARVVVGLDTLPLDLVRLDLSADSARRFCNGLEVLASGASDETQRAALLGPGGVLLGVGEKLQGTQRYRPVVVIRNAVELEPTEPRLQPGQDAHFKPT